jgi:hypothetical protein
MRAHGNFRENKRTIVRSFNAVAGIASLLLMSFPSRGGGDIVVDVPPPAPRIEIEQAPRDGYVWSPGYWEWNGRFYKWIAGTFITERRGRWVADHWDPAGSRWHYVPGHWER